MTAGAPLVIATVARERGITGVHTHVRQLREYLARTGDRADLVTPHSWAEGSAWRKLLLAPLFGARIVLERVYGPANVWWYRSSHEFFLRRALRRRLAQEGPCTVYAQCPVSARAALAARSAPHQRVVLAVHFRISQADEWADKGQIPRGGRVYRWIRDNRTTGRSARGRTGLRLLVGTLGSAGLDAGGRSGRRRRRHPELRRRARGERRAGNQGRDLVTVGNLEAVKNHRYLLRVLAAARQAGYVYTLDVFGEGVERGAPSRPGRRTRSRATRCGCRVFAATCRRGCRAMRPTCTPRTQSRRPWRSWRRWRCGLPVVSSPAGGARRALRRSGARSVLAARRRRGGGSHPHRAHGVTGRAAHVRGVRPRRSSCTTTPLTSSYRGCCASWSRRRGPRDAIRDPLSRGAHGPGTSTAAGAQPPLPLLVDLIRDGAETQAFEGPVCDTAACASPRVSSPYPQVEELVDLSLSPDRACGRSLHGAAWHQRPRAADLYDASRTHLRRGNHLTCSYSSLLGRHWEPVSILWFCPLRRDRRVEASLCLGGTVAPSTRHRGPSRSRTKAR